MRPLDPPLTFNAPRDLPSIFRTAVGLSVKFPCGPRTFSQLLSTFHVAEAPSVNFLHGCRPSSFRAVTGLSVNFRHFSVLPVDLLSTSLNFPRDRVIFRPLL